MRSNEIVLLKTILEPFEELTRRLMSENNPMLNLLYPTVCTLPSACKPTTNILHALTDYSAENDPDFQIDGEMLKDKLFHATEKRFPLDDLIQLATSLDPRFRVGPGFFNPNKEPF